MKKVLMTLYALSGLVFNYLPTSFLSPYFQVHRESAGRSGGRTMEYPVSLN